MRRKQDRHKKCEIKPSAQISERNERGKRDAEFRADPRNAGAREFIVEIAAGAEKKYVRQQNQSIYKRGKGDEGTRIGAFYKDVLNRDLMAQIDACVDKHNRQKWQKSVDF